jgi:hypothetical protein
MDYSHNESAMYADAFLELNLNSEWTLTSSISEVVVGSTVNVGLHTINWEDNRTREPQKSVL